MITWLLIRYNIITDTWEPSSILGFFSADILLEVLAVNLLLLAVRVALA